MVPTKILTTATQFVIPVMSFIKENLSLGVRVGVAVTATDWEGSRESSPEVGCLQVALVRNMASTVSIKV